MTSKTTGPGARRDRPIRRVEPRQHDTYRDPAKPKQPTVCDGCGAFWQGGRWTWGPAPAGDLARGACPACRRIRDRYPAGTIRLHPRYDEHADEIRGMIANVEEVERAEHPLERVMEVRATGDGLEITTTGLHIARRLAARLERRFHEKPDLRYPPEQNRIVVDFRE